MLGMRLDRILAALALVTVIAAIPISVWHRQRARYEIGAVSARFVEAASKLDLVALRGCLTDEGRASLPTYYTRIVAKKISELNRGVRVSARVEIVEVTIGAGEATARLKLDVTERGTRLGKPVNTHITDECAVACVYDGERWLVDLDRTLKEKRFPVADISLFRECLPK